MVATDEQVRRLREEMSRHGTVGLAALKAGLSRNTAGRYLQLGKLPSESRQVRTWRTRPDPFERDWPSVAARLADVPEFEAKILFEELMAQHPDRYHPGQLRTFQRHVKTWRVQHGPDREVFFPQEHRPGEAAQTDFTWCNELSITIAGEAFVHMLCHVMLPCSNWEWATVCRSESLLALKRGVQASLFELGRVPSFHQIDNSTAATHDLPSGKRTFNDEYVAFMAHFGMTPRTIALGQKHQNGDVEASNGVLKRRLEQHLLLRGSRDFPDVETYETWVQDLLRKANRPRREKLEAELSVMAPLPARKLPEWREVETRVTSWSTVRVQRNSYSVPSRLIGERVRVRVYDDHIEVFHGSVLQLATDRLVGRARHRIDYRHIIASLARKPGAFPRYRYREELFPSLTFRRAYDALVDEMTERKADIEYLRILYLAAETMESEVEAVLDETLSSGQIPCADTLRQRVEPAPATPVPELDVPAIDLSGYDELLLCPAGRLALAEASS